MSGTASLRELNACARTFRGLVSDGNSRHCLCAFTLKRYAIAPFLFRNEGRSSSLRATHLVCYPRLTRAGLAINCQCWVFARRGALVASQASSSRRGLELVLFGHGSALYPPATKSCFLCCGHTPFGSTKRPDATVFVLSLYGRSYSLATYLEGFRRLRDAG